MSGSSVAPSCSTWAADSAGPAKTNMPATALYVVALVLAGLVLLGVLKSHAFGGYIQVLLVIVIVIVVLMAISGRNPLGAL